MYRQRPVVFHRGWEAREYAPGGPRDAAPDGPCGLVRLPRGCLSGFDSGTLCLPRGRCGCGPGSPHCGPFGSPSGVIYRGQVVDQFGVPNWRYRVRAKGGARGSIAAPRLSRAYRVISAPTLRTRARSVGAEAIASGCTPCVACHSPRGTRLMADSGGALGASGDSRVGLVRPGSRMAPGGLRDSPWVPWHRDRTGEWHTQGHLGV